MHLIFHSSKDYYRMVRGDGNGIGRTVKNTAYLMVNSINFVSRFFFLRSKNISILYGRFSFIFLQRNLYVLLTQNELCGFWQL